MSVDVSLNGIDWSILNNASIYNSPLWLIYHPTPVIYSIVPDTAFWTGGSVLKLTVLHVSSLLYDNELSSKFCCNFGGFNFTVPAFYTSDYIWECTVPSILQVLSSLFKI